jgi:hypothetical protein
MLWPRDRAKFVRSVVTGPRHSASKDARERAFGASPANSAFTRVCDALWPGSLGRGDIPRAIALPYRGMGARQIHRNTIEIIRGYLEIASRYYL